MLNIIKKGTSETILTAFSEPIPSFRDKDTVSFPAMLIIEELFSKD